MQTPGLLADGHCTENRQTQPQVSNRTHLVLGAVKGSKQANVLGRTWWLGRNLGCGGQGRLLLALSGKTGPTRWQAARPAKMEGNGFQTESRGGNTLGTLGDSKPGLRAAVNEGTATGGAGERAQGLSRVRIKALY